MPRFWQDHAVGDTVAELKLPPISRHTLAVYCSASGDHNPIHVDIDFARQAGLDDVIAHGMLVMAYLGRLLTQLSTPAQLRSYRVRFESITPVHDVLTCSAVLKSCDSAGEHRSATLELVARSASGQVRARGEAVITS